MKNKFILIFLVFNLFLSPVLALEIDYSQEIEEIQKNIEAQQTILEELDGQKKIYEDKIEIKRKTKQLL